MKSEPILTGQLDLLLLAILARGPAHGYAVIDALRVRSGGHFDLPEGTIYPALYRLEAAGHLHSDAKVVNGRTRRVYRLTAAGRRALNEARDSWRVVKERVEAVLGDLRDGSRA